MFGCQRLKSDDARESTSLRWERHHNTGGSGDLTFRQDAEEILCFLRGFQVEVMFADNAFRVSRLDRRLADGAEFRDEHRN